MPTRTNTKVLLLLGICLPAATALSACAHVKPDEMESRLSTLRSELQAEIAEGDRRTAEQANAELSGVAAGVADLTDQVANLEEDLASMESDFGAEIQRLATALRFDMPVYFAFDDAELRSEDLPVLDRFAEIVAQHYPQGLITAEGFTDPAGDEEYNLRLGQRRAEAVVAYLVEKGGLTGERLRAVSYGEDTRRQIAGNSHGPGNEGWQNRRVALVIDHAGR